MWTAPRVDPRDEPFIADERTMLDAWLERQREMLLRTCGGLTGEQLARRSVPPSDLSVLGLVRHLTDVERTWFRRRLLGLRIDSVYWRPDSEDAAFHEVDPARAEQDYAALVAEQRAAREAVAGLSLDTEFIHQRYGRMSLRWSYQHLINEYAQHNGHADLLRQCVDGATAS